MLTSKTHFNMDAVQYEAYRQGPVEERRNREARRVLDPQRSSTRQVLEIGCGTGKFLDQLAADYPDLSFVGVDIDASMVEHAQRKHTRANARFEHRDLTQEGETAAYQFIYSIDLIHHIKDFSTFFRAVHRALSPGGTWLVIEPNVYHPYIYRFIEKMRRAGFDEDQYRPWVAEPLLREAGFRIAWRRYMSLFPNWVPVLRVLSQVERLLENCRFLGGSVVYQLMAEDTSVKASAPLATALASE
jgi:trans-aconitate methyltransferase